ncbi:MAG: DUF1565 domain-containing protein [Lentisphaeria bacterium]|nr:DUF1565 domain-containing protein [Lentisphaeria bacterium]
MKKFLGIAAVIAMTFSVMAGEWYVSQTTGKKKGPGTKEAPFKAISDAVKAAAAGDTIYVAEGTYTGLMGASEIIIDKPVTLMGGYAADFSERNLQTHPALIQPKNEKNDTKGLSVITLKMPAGAGPAMVLDGIVVDQGYMNSYHDVKGKPEGVETGMWLEPPAKGSKDQFASAKSYSVYAETQNRFEGDIVIQNCIFANAGNFAVNISKYKGTVKILNNIFVASRMESCEVSGSANAQNPSSELVDVEFANNTVLFTWSRTDELSDMGYGFRCLTMVKSNIHHNIFGLNVMAGIGNDKGDAKQPGVSRLVKNITINDNVFFLNKNADVTVTKSPSILKLFVDGDEFEDMCDYPGIEDVDSNISLKDPAVFKGRINEAYLNAFLNISYSETTDYDENSPANIFRAAMGMNKVGKIETKVSMYGNRYPLAACYKLFAAREGYAAQLT